MEYTIKVGTDCRTGYFASLRGAKCWATKIHGKTAYIQIFQNDVMVSERQAFGNWVNIEVTEKTEEEKAEGYKFLWVKKSANVKTGNIPQTYTGKASCPVSCPFRKVEGDKDSGGCFGENHHTLRAWNRAEVGINELQKLVQADTAEGQLIRHNVAGDMAVIGTDTLNAVLVEKLCNVYAGRKAYTYTHCRLDAASVAVIKEAQDKGFLINASCETYQEARKAKDLGINACIVLRGELTAQDKAQIKAQHGIDVTVCPAQLFEDMDCKRCQLCAKNRNAVVGFIAHGNQKKKAIAAVEKKINFYR